VNRKLVKKTKDFFSNINDIPIDIRDITVKNFINNIQKLACDFGIDLRKIQQEFIRLDNFDIESIKGLENRNSILEKLKFDKHTQDLIIINLEYYIRDNILLQKVSFGLKNGINNDVKFEGKRLDKYI
jgi:hypothetical protein